MIEYVAYTSKGVGKKKNEDRVMINNIVTSANYIQGKEKEGLIAVVCDGVGGTKGGNVAAEMTASSFDKYSISKASPYSLACQIHAVNASVVNEQMKQKNHTNMATTVAGIVLWNNRYYLFYAGDTRIYEVKSNNLHLKTKDHKQEIIDLISGEKKEILTRYIGGNGNACDPYIIRGLVSEPERLFMICSDGIYKNLPQEKMEEILLGNGSLLYKNRAICELSLQNGSKDDISLALIRYTEEN